MTTQSHSSKTLPAVARSVPSVNADAPFFRIATFHARRGCADRLAEQLLQAATLVAEASGCEHWLVHRDHDDADVVRVSELWSTRRQCEAALAAPEVRAHTARVMELIDGPPEMSDSEPLGGARAVRGATGAVRFAILDAPDLSRDPELLGRYELGQVAEARYVREPLGAVQIGLTHYRLGPRRRQGWAHRHRVAEELYVAVNGSGHIEVDDDHLQLRSLDAVRVAPGSVRELAAGDDGLEVLAFGIHSPGDGELITDRPVR
jgi:quinol monooxygenase YgiN/mannose-6-phosphate isomerase-like protein (cupin superfamily)